MIAQNRASPLSCAGKLGRSAGLEHLALGDGSPLPPGYQLLIGSFLSPEEVSGEQTVEEGAWALVVERRALQGDSTSSGTRPLHLRLALLCGLLGPEPLLPYGDSG